MNYNTEKSRKKVYTIKKRIFTGLLSFFNACVTMYLTFMQGGMNMALWIILYPECIPLWIDVKKMAIIGENFCLGQDGLHWNIRKSMIKKWHKEISPD